MHLAKAHKLLPLLERLPRAAAAQLLAELADSVVAAAVGVVVVAAAAAAKTERQVWRYR